MHLDQRAVTRSADQYARELIDAIPGRREADLITWPDADHDITP